METRRYSAAFAASARTLPLLSGLAGHPEIALDYQDLGMEEIFQRQIDQAAFDIAECTIGSYLLALSRGEQRLTALPVPLVRRFRQDQIYVAADSPLHSLADLAGKRFGMPEYQATPAIWLRALMRDSGIATDGMQWVTYRPERVPIEPPAKRGNARNVFDGLLTGEIDAGFMPIRPPLEQFPLDGKGGAIRRLMPDPWEEDRRYYARTQIFPIGTVVTLRREITDSVPGFANTVFAMFNEAKSSALKGALNLGQPVAMDPFQHESIERSLGLFGDDPWPYGFKRCWAEIDAFMSYMQADKLLDRKLAPEEIFHADSLGS